MSGDGSIEPTEQQIAALIGGGPEEMARPINMINLLRFRERAAYPEGFEADPCSGEEAYRRYAEGAFEAVSRVGGRPIWGARVDATPIGPSEERWDEAFIVFYPSREAFVAMVQDPEYLAILPHRTAALSDSRLIMCESPEDVPGMFGARTPDGDGA